jgi:hypothetical protein
MIRNLALAAIAFALTAPLSAQPGSTDYDLAESRLRGCLLAGASAAPTSELRAAVVSVRSFCAPQINRVRGYRVAAAAEGLSGQAAREAEDSAVRALNDEIARAIANFTGLTE